MGSKQYAAAAILLGATLALATAVLANQQIAPFPEESLPRVKVEL
jgi:hypothetical protein